MFMGQHGAHLGPVGPRWAPCWPHKLSYQWRIIKRSQLLSIYFLFNPISKGWVQLVHLQPVGLRPWSANLCWEPCHPYYWLTHWSLGSNFQTVISENMIRIHEHFLWNCSVRMRVNSFDNKSILVQIMGWCRQVASHYLSQCSPRPMSSYGVTRPQWLNSLRDHPAHRRLTHTLYKKT